MKRTFLGVPCKVPRLFRRSRSSSTRRTCARRAQGLAFGFEEIFRLLLGFVGQNGPLVQTVPRNDKSSRNFRYAISSVDDLLDGLVLLRHKSLCACLYAGRTGRACLTNQRQSKHPIRASIIKPVAAQAKALDYARCLDRCLLPLARLTAAVNRLPGVTDL